MISIKESRKICEAEKARRHQFGSTDTTLNIDASIRITDELFPESLRLLSEARELVEWLQWQPNEESGGLWCPKCLANKKQGHDTKCRVAKFLAGVGE
jgi:hypothetical protein